MNHRAPLFAFAVVLLPGLLAAAPLPKPLVAGLKNPESVVVGLGGKVYVTEIGEFDKDGDGRVVHIENGQITPFATGFDDPKGMVAFQKFLFVADKTRVWRIDDKGRATVFAAADKFPQPPRFLNDLAIDEVGTLFASDSGDLQGGAGALFRITPQGKVTLEADPKQAPHMKTPNGLLHDNLLHLLVLDFHTGELHTRNLDNRQSEKVAEGFGGGDGLAFDRFGRLYVSDWKNGKVFVIPRPGQKPILLAEGFQAAADICLDAAGKNILVPDMKAGTLTALPAGVPGAEVDETPLPVKAEVAFPKIAWTGWKGEDNGRLIEFRPIVLTHAGDGSNRVFVATQQGVIHDFPNDQQVEKSHIFLDIQERVRYYDKENEEGFLGLAFHPKFKENGELFVFYTVRQPKLTNVVSRFRLRKDDPTRADPASEEELFRITRPFWNHDGGTICFGPDGFLYIVLGDGGAGNDPYGNGQNLGTPLGKVLRIDVDHKSPGLNYAIPKDNPFVGQAGARGEIWCYGMRNPWRIAFDRQTGALWCGEVGQNLWEEINLLVAGGNYGWSRREAGRRFGPQGVEPNPKMIEPIWEYDHVLGKSITGGHVYRGQRLPELAGHYLYADYVTGKLWGLRYDDKQQRVVANRPISYGGMPILSFGEDESGDVYFMTATPTGKAVHRFVKADAPPGKT